VFNTTDVAVVVAKASAAGGTIERQPTKSATSGSLIAFVVDPGGNRIEVIQPPAN
jgi:predicted enzyme related to lactoylglutathione lyase